MDLQGWQPDPFHRFAERYYSAGQPTKLVRTGTREFYDPIPPDAAGAWQDPQPTVARTPVAGPAVTAAVTTAAVILAPVTPAGDTKQAAPEPARFADGVGFEDEAAFNRPEPPAAAPPGGAPAAVHEALANGQGEPVGGPAVDVPAAAAQEPLASEPQSRSVAAFLAEEPENGAQGGEPPTIAPEPAVKPAMEPAMEPAVAGDAERIEPATKDEANRLAEEAPRAGEPVPNVAEAPAPAALVEPADLEPRVLSVTTALSWFPPPAILQLLRTTAPPETAAEPEPAVVRTGPAAGAETQPPPEARVAPPDEAETQPPPEAAPMVIRLEQPEAVSVGAAERVAVASARADASSETVVQAPEPAWEAVVQAPEPRRSRPRWASSLALPPPTPPLAVVDLPPQPPSEPVAVIEAVAVAPPAGRRRWPSSLGDTRPRPVIAPPAPADTAPPAVPKPDPEPALEAEPEPELVPPASPEPEPEPPPVPHLEHKKPPEPPHTPPPPAANRPSSPSAPPSGKRKDEPRPAAGRQGRRKVALGALVVAVGLLGLPLAGLLLIHVSNVQRQFSQLRASGVHAEGTLSNGGPGTQDQITFTDRGGRVITRTMPAPNGNDVLPDGKVDVVYVPNNPGNATLAHLVVGSAHVDAALLVGSGLGAVAGLALIFWGVVLLTGSRPPSSGGSETAGAHATLPA